MTAVVAMMVLAVLVALVVISVFSQQEKDDWTQNRPGHVPDAEETRLGDLLDP